MVIVDSTVWIDYFNNIDNPETEWLDHALSSRSLAITDLILCEVLQGIRDEAAFHNVRRQLAGLVVISGDEQLATESAENYRRLRNRGITVRKTIDCLIATRCITGNHQLLHHDRDFDPFEKHLSLRVVHP